MKMFELGTKALQYPDLAELAKQPASREISRQLGCTTFPLDPPPAPKRR